MLTRAAPYVPDLFAYRRRPTRVVMVGDVGVGGDNPIRVQSMTTTLTRDIDATVAQAARLAAVGCEIVRITTPTPADARCLLPIKQGLAARGIHVPLVADIHFSPAAALAAAEYADKVRINPGNYTDSRKFAIKEYSDAQYAAELERVEERFTPLVLACKQRGVAMRIGSNHGSLSDRIMNRFGDTPEGMVESALEFVAICRKHDYHEIILSMKASNPKVMIAAYRLLAARMDDAGMDYPFHLGVTEAGNAEDGRIKSAIGIGSLLEDGIGDTIRVSLTEEPEAEVPVAFAIATRYVGRPTESPSHLSPDVPWDLYHFSRRPSTGVTLGDLPVGGDTAAAVVAAVPDPLDPHALAHILRWASPAGRRRPKPDAALIAIRHHDDVAAVQRFATRLRQWPQARLALIASGDDPDLLAEALSAVDAVALNPHTTSVHPFARQAHAAGKPIVLNGIVPVGGDWREAVDSLLDTAEEAHTLGVDLLLSLTVPEAQRIHAYRYLAARCHDLAFDLPILLCAPGEDDPLLPASITLGALLCDGIGDAILLTGAEDVTELQFNILQAAGTRLSKTDYVACPSCGRTLFDLQETTERIKQKTSHLVGVRLAIMGCIVNGPGEMADADFGYVGGAPGQVNLYVGKECVEKGVPAEIADERLIELIKAHGKWQEEDEETAVISSG